MVMTRSIFLLFALLLIKLLLASPVSACSCAGKPTLLRELSQGYTKTVVTGRIESVHKIREEGREHDFMAYRSATLVVDKVFMGNVKVGDRLVLAQGSGADCSFSWTEKQVGDDWLFYLGEPISDRREYPVQVSSELQDSDDTPMYRTSYCGRSTPLEAGSRDVAYLNNMVKLKGKTRVSGDLSFGDRSVEGIEVRLTGKDVSLKTKYLKGGFFEIYDVPPGEYMVEIVPPKGWIITDDGRIRDEITELPLTKRKKNQKLIRVAKGGHTDLDLSLAPDTKIAGRVLSPSGTPMSKVCVKAEPVSDDKDSLGGGACTDERGEFSISTIQPGNYVLIANSEGKIDAEQPFSTLYYPGVPSKENAGVLAVEAGQYHLNVEFQIPELNRLIEISGRVLFADDKPVEGIWVNFKPTSQEKFSTESLMTDKEGRFLIKVPFGAVGAVQASKYFSEYTHPNCSTILSLAKESGSSLNTNELEVDGTRSIVNAVLRFPFDFCKEKD